MLDRSMPARGHSQAVHRMAGLYGVPLICRFINDRNAGPTVEFGVLAAPFMAALFAILQTAMVFFTSQALETAAATSARLIFTGQAQTNGWSAAQFKSQVCNTVKNLFNCSSSVYVDVETYTTFAGVNTGMPITNGTFNSGSLGYNPGGPGSIVMLRLYYQFPAYVNLLGFNLSNLSSGQDLLAATAVFKNEPYSSS
jgi:Flp pilus assembly protein TadG